MRLVGIDVGATEIRVARGERVLGAVRLVGLERVPLGAPGDAADALAGLAGLRGAALSTALAADAVALRILVMPFRDRRRLARTVPLELRGRLPVDPGDAALSFAPLGPAEDGTAVLAAIVRRADLDAHLAPFGAARLAPARVDLAPLPVWNLLPADDDAALVVADGGRSTVSVRRTGRLVGLRALGVAAGDAAGLARETRWSLAGMGGVPSRLVLAGADASEALAAALAAATGTTVVPLARAARIPAPDGEALAACAVAAGLVVGAGMRRPAGLEFDARAGGPAGVPRRAAALAAAALALGLVDLALVHHGLARRDAALVRTIRAEAAAVLPDAPLAAPRAELEMALAARGSTHPGTDRASALTVLRELSAHVPPALQLDLDEVTVEPDGVRLHGRTASFDSVDALRRGLAASPLFAEVAAEETRTTVDGREVEFLLHAQRRPAGRAS